MPPSAAPLSMKMGFPSIWRGVGVGCSERKDPPLKADAFFPLPRGDFHGSSPCRLSGAIEHENGIPLHWRGVGVGCSERKDPPLKADAFFPLPRGDFHGSLFA